MNEKQTIEEAKKGNEDSFSSLIKTHQIRLYQYLLIRCHSIHDAEDILQDTFINAFKYLDSYDSVWEFSTWLFTIANRLIKKQHNMYYQTEQISTSPQSTAPDKCLIDQSNIWIIIKSIIKSEAYDVLWFYYVEELTIKEIAKVLNKSISWVKMTLFRNKKKLSLNKKLKAMSNDYLMLSIIL